MLSVERPQEEPLGIWRTQSSLNHLNHVDGDRTTKNSETKNDV